MGTRVQTQKWTEWIWICLPSLVSAISERPTRISNWWLILCTYENQREAMRVQTMEQGKTVICHDTACITFIFLWITVDIGHRKLYKFLLKIKICLLWKAAPELCSAGWMDKLLMPLLICSWQVLSFGLNISCLVLIYANHLLSQPLCC